MLLIFLAAWKRPEITEICFMGIRRLRKNSLRPIEAFCVISEESMIPLCKKYGIHYTMYKNDPLGEKKNHGLNEAMNLNWDYLIEIGSDDVLKNELIDLYEPYFNKGWDFFGVKDVLIINSDGGECRRLKSDTTYGLGRVIKRSVIEKYCYGVEVEALDDIISPGRTTAKGDIGFFQVDAAEGFQRSGIGVIVGKPRYRLWKDGINRGLDNNSTYFLMTQGIGHRAIPTDKPLAIDIKGEDNIWKFNKELGMAYELDKALEGLSEEEKSALFALIKRKKRQEIEYGNLQ